MRTTISVFLTVLLLTACAEELSIDQQIIASLRKMEIAAEAGEHFEFISYVADSFSGQQGTMDRREFHRFMIFQINKNRRLQAQFFPIYVKETGEDMASAHFRILVTGGGGLLPDRGQLFDVETHWLRDGSDWNLDKADWKTVRLPDPPLSGA